MKRWIFLLVFGATLLVSSAPVDAIDPPEITISGGGLPFAVHLSAVDADAFSRRLNYPPRLDDEPAWGGATYRVDSSYWDDATTDPDGEELVGTLNEARYIPDGGYAAVALAEGSDAWLVLDLRQQAILNRYIRLAREGSISATPGSFEVLREAAADEPIGVAVAGHDLSREETARFWEVAKPIMLRRDLIASTPGSPWPPSGQYLTWLTFTLPEGHSVRLAYSVVTGVLLDPFASELYPVPARWLVPVLGDEAAPGPNFGLSPDNIAESSDRGISPWLAVMVGGGLLSLASAIALRRRYAIG